VNQIAWPNSLGNGFSRATGAAASQFVPALGGAPSGQLGSEAKQARWRLLSLEWVRSRLLKVGPAQLRSLVMKFVWIGPTFRLLPAAALKPRETLKDEHSAGG